MTVEGETDMENTLYLETKEGRVIIDLFPEVAPKHVTRIKQLVRQGFYDGLKFHRVIPGFMAQGGDPSGNGTGGSGENIPAEFSDRPHIRGTASMARSAQPDSADSQFFICFEAAPHLDGQYSVWGQVAEGMEHIDAICPDARNPDLIIKMQIAADAE